MYCLRDVLYGVLFPAFSSKALKLDLAGLLALFSAVAAFPCGYGVAQWL